MVAISARNSLTRSEMRCDRMASAPIPQTRLSFCSTPNCATQRIGTWLAQLRPGLCGEEVHGSLNGVLMSKSPSSTVPRTHFGETATPMILSFIVSTRVRVCSSVVPVSTSNPTVIDFRPATVS